MDTTQAALQEYQALRSEILAHFDRRSSRLNVAWASISALLVAAVVAEFPELACVALLLSNSAWIDEMRWHDSMIRIGTYIRIILEGQIEGLQWETIISTIFGKPEARFNLLTTLLSAYGIFAIVCITLSIVLYVTKFSQLDEIRQIIFLTILALGILFTFINLYRAANLPKRRQYWDQLFTDLADSSKFTK